MIQVLGLRPTQVSPRPIEVFFEKGWRFNNLFDVFDNEKLTTLLDKIPEAERYNVYFTVANCYEQKGRKLRAQWAIPFDIDGMSLPINGEVEEAKRIVQVATKAIGVNYEDVSVVYSGNGVQFFIHITKPITDEAYFDRVRVHYGGVLAKIKHALSEAGIKGVPDPSVWSRGRLMRLPNTVNRKKDKPARTAQLIQKAARAIEFDLEEASGILHHDDGEIIPDTLLKQYPKPDTATICNDCKFLVYCSNNQAKVTEPQWYAMTSITARLANGSALTHEWSNRHPQYTEYETDMKIEQALSAAGPRTCANIEQLWDGCKECDHYGKVTSPILIRGEDFLVSQDFGFRRRIIKKKGETTITIAGPPEYDELIKFFYKEYRFKIITEVGQIIIYNGIHWVYFHDNELRAWMTSHVVPTPSGAEMSEFLVRLKSHNLISSADLYQTREGLVNFSNCVLNISTGETHPHSPDYGFFDVRPFAYDPHATSPKFDKFLVDIMAGDEELAESLKEFGGYCISGDKTWLAQALVLVGTGRNGKSIFMRTLAKVVGESLVSSVAMQDLAKDTMRYQLVNKLFNYSEETSEDAWHTSTTFKTIVDGGMMSVKQLYMQPYNIANKTKLILSANTIPYTKDNTFGFYRRLAIIPFNVRFIQGGFNDNPMIEAELEAELAGICNSLLAAYTRLKERKVLKAHNKIGKFVEEYRYSNDTVLMFINERLQFDEDPLNPTSKDVKASELYGEYTMFCESTGFKPHNLVKFGKEFFMHTDLKSTTSRTPSGVIRVYKGIQITKVY